MKKFISEFKILLDGIIHSSANEKFKLNILISIPFWIASALAGLVAVIYAQLFNLGEEIFQYLFQHVGLWLFLISPTCFILSWYVVEKYAKFSRGSGIPQVMASLDVFSKKNLINQFLSLKIILIKIISSILHVLGGGAIGREGPTIQISAAIFHKINSILPKSWPKINNRNMIITGAAAGLAAAFNTPLGGIVFTVEELTKVHISQFRSALFIAVIIAGLTAQAILGPYLYLGYPQADSGSFLGFFYIIITAALVGIIASYSCKIILKLFSWKEKTLKKSWHHMLYLGILGIIFAAIGIFIEGSIFGSGKELMNELLFAEEKFKTWYTPFIRIFGPILSFTSGTSGGIFAPALAAGASVGSAFSEILRLNAEESNLLILIGMVSFLTGITRTPFTSAILVIEMTDLQNMIFQFMIAGVVANLASMSIDKHSFYDHLKTRYLKEIQV